MTRCEVKKRTFSMQNEMIESGTPLATVDYLPHLNLLLDVLKLLVMKAGEKARTGRAYSILLTWHISLWHLLNCRDNPWYSEELWFVHLGW
jgi:hypothetical protein